MGLKKTDLKLNYNTDDDDIIDEFYNKSLKHAIKYRRAVAFFNSSSLVNIYNGIEYLIKNNGTMELLISPNLDSEDIDAIDRGYGLREKIVENKIINELHSIPEKEKDKYNLLAWLISKNILDIKIVFRNDTKYGLFHEKIGLIYDRKGDYICFQGSNNETNQAMTNNYESFSVYMSWNERDLVRINYIEDQFDKLWNNKSEVWESFYMTDAIRNKIMEYKLDKNPFEENNSKKDRDIGKNMLPEVPKNITPREYQKEAINLWYDHGGKGILEMATGERVIIVIGCINALVSRVSGTFTQKFSCIA